ncbi:MAG: glycosyltransferase, partial [Candidatus Solibacter sp.]
MAPDTAALPRTMPSGRAWPKISIVTPTYNQGAYIEETLLSVLHQRYPNVEHIVMDGGSTDATPAVLERYRDRLAHVRSEPDNGQSHAINKGMALATGEILTWLNSDDMLAPGALAAVALAFDTNQADMVAGICRLYRDGELVSQHITSCAEGPLPLGDLLDLDGAWNAGQFFYQPEVMFTRELWQRAGGYVNDWLHYSMDYEMWLRFAEVGARLHVIGRPVAWFRLHEAQKTHVTARFQAELVVCRRDFLRQREMAFEPPPAAARPATRNQLRITMLNDIGPFYGAGIAHVRMARALAWAGHEVSLVSILDRSILGIESPHYTSADVVARVVETRPHLVIVGNLHAAGADAFLLEELCERFPVSVVMHDFWSITGRCAYPGKCEKYLHGCDETCPTPDEYPALAPEKIADEWRKKRLVLGGAHGPSLLANSAWAAGVAERALAADVENVVRPAAVAPFHLSFPLDVFRPRDPMMCRELLGLPADKFIVLLPGGVGERRKGAMAFLDSLGRLGLPDLLVVTLGMGDPELKTTVPVRQLGQIHGQLKVAMAHSAADLVVAPSSEETFGQTVVEAIACGTPALAYAVTGTCEAIRHGVTGVLAEADPDSLAAAVRDLYERPEARRDLAGWGRLYVENEWSEFAASRRLYLALRAVDADGRIGLGRNIRFSGQAPALPAFQTVAKCEEGWRPCQGISQLEYPLPEYGLGPFRWAYGPGAVVELFAAEAGLHRVMLSYRNVQDGQQVALRCNGVECGAYDLVTTGFGSGRMLVANVALEEGPNLLQLRFRTWDTT